MSYAEVYNVCKEEKIPRFLVRTRIPKQGLINSILEVQRQRDERSGVDIDAINNKLQIGDVVAFMFDEKLGKAMSGRVVARSKSRKLLIVKTKKGDEITILYNDVLWIKRGPWPEKIYAMLKKRTDAKWQQYGATG